MVRVAALYVSPGGPYMHMPDVDAWDEARDARLYDGPYPVVAHPACGPWGRVYWRYKGSEGGADCALHAVESVRAFGGVLEHPRESNLWGKRSSKRKTYAKRPVGVLDLPLPGEPPDTWGGYTIEVEQVSWGAPLREAHVVVYCRLSSGEPASAAIAGLLPDTRDYDEGLREWRPARATQEETPPDTARLRAVAYTRCK